MPCVSTGLGDGAGTTRGDYAIVHSCCKRQCMSSPESKWELSTDTSNARWVLLTDVTPGSLEKRFGCLCRGYHAIGSTGLFARTFSQPAANGGHIAGSLENRKGTLGFALRVLERAKEGVRSARLTDEVWLECAGEPSAGIQDKPCFSLTGIWSAHHSWVLVVLHIGSLGFALIDAQ